MENLLLETKQRLEEEKSKRTREMNNNQQYNDKINMLEKQLMDIQEKYKNETENSQKMKKQLAELRLSKSDVEQKANDLQSLLTGLQAARDALQQEVADLQTRLAQERNARIQMTELQKELEGKIHSLVGDLDRSVTREQQAMEDNRSLSDKISELEKEIASIECELKAVQSRYHQEVKAHQETEKSRQLNNEEANMQEVKGKLQACYWLGNGTN